MKEQKSETKRRIFVDRDRLKGDRCGYPSVKDDRGGDRNPGQDKDKEKIDRVTRDRCAYALNPGNQSQIFSHSSALFHVHQDKNEHMRQEEERMVPLHNGGS
jgi:hypothetical protein